MANVAFYWFRSYFCTLSHIAFGTQLKFPVWINADIIPGPVNNTYTDAVDPDRFLQACAKLPNATLSIGWTTRWGADFTDGEYTSDQIKKMLTAINNNQIHNSTHSITYPIRAGIAANSLANLQTLMTMTSAKNKPTFTIWSSPDDAVNIDKLRQVIFAFGLDRVYIDVPDEIRRQLNLNNVSGRASSLIHFGFVTMCVFLLSVFLSNRQNLWSSLYLFLYIGQEFIGHYFTRIKCIYIALFCEKESFETNAPAIHY